MNTALRRDEGSPDARRGEFTLLDETFDELFPLCRSITGDGLRRTLSIIGRHVPLEQHSFPTGYRAFDWEVPHEWRISAARLTGPDGGVICDFDRSNLEVMNYSTPVDEELDLEALRPHLHTAPHVPDAVPYVTSYYRRRWGFCLSHRVLETLEPGTYHAYVDSELLPGALDLADCVLPGEEAGEVLLTSYVCHPSLANNELSGPLVLMALYRRLAERARRRFTYRFVWAPETIGSICYLSAVGKRLKEVVHAGLVLTCLGGDENGLSYKLSRRGDAAADRVVTHLFDVGAIDGEVREFDPSSGSDERQFCSPGFDLPVGQMARTVYGCYDGYHNSFDTKERMSIAALQRSVDELEIVLDALELDGYYVNLKPYGEPKLDKYDLYPDMNAPSTWRMSAPGLIDDRERLAAILGILSMADGTKTLTAIAAALGRSIFDIAPIVGRLCEAGLLAGPSSEPQELR